MIDISWPISAGMTKYKKRKLVSFDLFRTWEKDNARQSLVSLDSHCGTHIDAPAHYVKNGKTIDKIDLGLFNGKCRVLDLTSVTGGITKEDLVSKNIKKGEIILLKTKNSSLSPTAYFKYDFVYLSATGAKYLASIGVKTVGIDYLGIERDQPDHGTHAALLGKNIVIIEGLRLGKVKEGPYTLMCLPLAYKGLEAAPARAVLIEG